MEETWIAVLTGAIATFVSSFTTWFFTKRKYNTEVDANLITNMQESLEFYKTLADDNKARLEEVLREKAELRKQVGDLTSTLANYGLQKLMEEK